MADLGEVGGWDLAPEGDRDGPTTEGAGEVAAEPQQATSGELFGAAFDGVEADAEVARQGLVGGTAVVGELGDEGAVERA